jgi:hypothetical protein
MTKSMKHKEPTWADRSLEVREALIERGYRVGRSISTPEMRITVYLDGAHTLILSEQDGGWDLYRPLTESLKVADVIDKIPRFEPTAAR